MITNSLATPSIVSSKLTYPVLVESKESIWTAQVLGWSECQAEGMTREEALANLKQGLMQRLASSEIVYLELPELQPKNPWLKLAGKYKNDPQFAELVAEIERERRELDAQVWQDEQEKSSGSEVL